VTSGAADYHASFTQALRAHFELATLTLRRVHCAAFPSSTETTWPVTNDAFSDARNTIALAISSGAPARFSGTPAIRIAAAHEAETLPMVISLVLSISGVSLMPEYARRLLPPSVVSRRLHGRAPTVALAVSYNASNASPSLVALLAAADRAGLFRPAAD
jgi:hypothetical protein